MIYLDNAATTRKKPISVIIKTMLSITKYNANAGRGGHKLAAAATDKIMQARQNINDYFNGYGLENTIFTASCTESLNLAILGTIEKDAHVITTVLEHNSVLRPLTNLIETKNVSVTYLSPEKNNVVTAEEINKAITDKTKAVVITNISNVIGTENDIYEIGKLCKEKNLIFICDCAQSAGHKKIDMQKANISCLAVAGHKGLLGIYGGSVLLLNDTIKINPLKFGGTGSSSYSLKQPDELPEKLESGSLNLPSILALNEGVKYCKKHQEKITDKIQKLSNLFLYETKNIKNLIVYGKDKNGVFAFNFKDIPSTDVSKILNDKYKICVRAGLHCAPLCHQFLQTTKQGAVRASFSCFTKTYEVKKLISALKQISETLDN